MNLFNTLYVKEQQIDDLLSRKAYIFKHELSQKVFELDLLKIQVVSTFVYEPPNVVENNSKNEQPSPNSNLTINSSLDSEKSPKKSTSETPNTLCLSIQSSWLDNARHDNDLETGDSVQSNILGNGDPLCTASTDDMLSAIYVFMNEEQSLTKATMFVKDKNNNSLSIISCNATYSAEKGFCAKFPLPTDQPKIKYKIFYHQNEFTHRYKLSAFLSKTIGCDGGSFPQILCAVYNYIHCNNLLRGTDPCMVICDDEFKKIFKTDQFHLKDIVSLLVKHFEKLKPVVIEMAFPNPAYLPPNCNNQTKFSDQSPYTMTHTKEEYVAVEVPTYHKNYMKRLLNVIGPTLYVDDATANFSSSATFGNIQSQTSNDEPITPNKLVSLHNEINQKIDECLSLGERIENLKNFIENPQLIAINNFKMCEYETDYLKCLFDSSHDLLESVINKDENK